MGQYCFVIDSSAIAITPFTNCLVFLVVSLIIVNSHYATGNFDLSRNFLKFFQFMNSILEFFQFIWSRFVLNYFLPGMNLIVSMRFVDQITQYLPQSWRGSRTLPPSLRKHRGRLWWWSPTSRQSRGTQFLLAWLYPEALPGRCDEPQSGKLRGVWEIEMSYNLKVWIIENSFTCVPERHKHCNCWDEVYCLSPKHLLLDSFSPYLELLSCVVSIIPVFKRTCKINIF